MLLLLTWFWLAFTVPNTVSKAYNDVSSDTHLQSSLSYCLVGPDRVYAIVSLYASVYAEETGRAGYISFYGDDDFNNDNRENVVYIDIDSSGNAVDGENPYRMCVPLKWETERAIP